MNETAADAALVERVRQGDADAFADLVRQHQRLLTGIAFGIVGDSGNTEELVQESFLAAWKSIYKFRGEASFKNWLCRILLNKARSRLRWERLRRLVSLDQPSSTPWVEMLEDKGSDADPEGLRLRDERSRAVRAAVADLPLQQRTAVILRANGLDVAEVARTMSVAEGTIKAHLHHARARLAAALGEE